MVAELSILSGKPALKHQRSYQRVLQDAHARIEHGKMGNRFRIFSREDFLSVVQQLLIKKQYYLRTTVHGMIKWPCKTLIADSCDHHNWLKSIFTLPKPLLTFAVCPALSL